MWRYSDLYPDPEYKRTVEVLAIHEAGHFVVGLFSGLTPTKTAITRNRENGIAQFTVINTEAPKKKTEIPIAMQQEAACLFAAGYQAGFIAERIFTSSEVEGFVFSNTSDIQISSKILRDAGLPAASEYPDLWAKNILHNNWRLVESIAKELLDKGCMDWTAKTAEEVDYLLTRNDNTAQKTAKKLQGIIA